MTTAAISRHRNRGFMAAFSAMVRGDTSLSVSLGFDLA
jgi:hypothetical protein